jgi:cytochrome c oxidase assembly protein subunit 15
MVGGAVIIGGITRLTESGLSMTQWHLVKGMRPPRSQAEWETEFEKYKQFPEYQVVHQDLTLEGYKKIFYWEYFHRMWGRTTGLAVLVPAAFFWARGWLSPALKKRAGIYSALVVLQGLYGWYMVKSGLASRPSRIQPGSQELPRISQYRLAGHLSLALLLYSSMLYTALGLLFPPTIAPAVAKVTRLRHVVHGAAATVFLTCVSGAFVAGLDAGLVYNSFPRMAGQWIPDDIASLSPAPVNICENPTTVQFNHRWLGTATLAYMMGVWALARGAPLPPRARMATNALAAVAFLQVGLGVATLLTFVPTSLASAHQTGAVSLLSAALWLMHELRKTLPRL